MLQKMRSYLGNVLARYLTKPLAAYEAFAVSEIEVLRCIMRPADVLLIEGNNRVSKAIKYLTQSTWSHAALYVGNAPGQSDAELIEADIVHGVIAVPLGKYAGFNLRICRPLGLTAEDQQGVVEYARAHLGMRYDLKNVFDLMRYLLPTPPWPSRYRRRLIAFGSGDPTRGICSTLIAQAFQSIRYPILPRAAEGCGEIAEQDQSDSTCLEARHYSHFTPRDFDLSPYFAVVKPTLETGFQYKRLYWHTQQAEALGGTQ